METIGEGDLVTFDGSLGAPTRYRMEEGPVHVPAGTRGRVKLVLGDVISVRLLEGEHGGCVVRTRADFLSKAQGPGTRS